MNQFFYATQIYDEKIILPKDEALHALKVLRKKNGDQIRVVDGKGNLYDAYIDSEDIQDCCLSIKSKCKDYGYQSYYIHIGIVPPKSHDRVELFVEKVVEIGVQEISFINAEHSERNNIKLNRIHKCAVSAMKQSLKAYLPQINDIVSMTDFIKSCGNSEKYIAHLNEDENDLLMQSATIGSDYCILIGPEGDFSLTEINESLQFGFEPVSLGANRLRTETAGIASCHILNLVNEKQ